MDSQPKTFNDLPDEMVNDIMMRLPLMADKLRMGRVSRRLYRCTNEHLRACTWPLEIHSNRSQPLKMVDVDIRSLITHGILTVAHKSYFNGIIIHLYTSKEMSSIEEPCRLLIEHAECLSKTREFKFNYHYNTEHLYTMLDHWNSGNVYNPHRPLLPDILYEVLAYCIQLQVLQISFAKPHFHKLLPSLNGKALTEIVLEGLGVSYETLTELFMTLKPNSLKRVRLVIFFEKYEDDPDQNIAPLFQQTSDGPWSALETLEYNFAFPFDDDAVDFYMIGDLFNMFPNLLNCSPNGTYSFRPTVQDHIDCIDRFLKSAEKKRSTVKQSITDGQFDYLGWSACELALLMEGILDRSPERSCKLTFDRWERIIGSGRRPVPLYHARLSSRGLTSFDLTNLTIRECPTGNVAPAGRCTVCRRFYDNTMGQIKNMIRLKQGGHLENYFMNPCQAHRMQPEVADVRANTEVKTSRDPETGRYAIDVGDLHITVDWQPCIEPGCVHCS